MRFSAETLERLYGREEQVRQAARYERLAARFEKLYANQTGVRFFSAPGRAEIGGNHTDHQSGRVLAASINMDTIAAALPNGGGTLVRVNSDGFPPVEVDLSDLSPRGAEKG
ncbi:MAG: galactokinase family protein, partial [Firmicutes bacterium]|nr:galactokinase family protein [Bacillota bacterium]